MLLPTIVFVLCILIYLFCYIVISLRSDMMVEDKIKYLNVLNLILFVLVCCYISYFFGGV